MANTAITGLALKGDKGDTGTGIPANGASTQLLQYDSAGQAKWITVSGDVTIADVGATTIAAGAVDLAMMANIATLKIVGRLTAETGVPEAITCTAAGFALLDDANAAAQIATLGLDADIATLALPANTTITAAGAALIDDAAASNQLTTLGAMPLAGGTLSGDMTLGENTAVALDPGGSADEKWSGITVTGTAGATLAVGDLCYLASSWKWLLADADAATTSGSVALGLCILAGNDTQATNMLLLGTMRSAAFPASITGGVQLYVSQTAGDMTTTIPAGADVVVRVCGWAILTEPNTVYFNPSTDFITRVS